jgi:hypothetical protein
VDASGRTRKERVSGDGAVDPELGLTRLSIHNHDFEGDIDQAIKWLYTPTTG